MGNLEAGRYVISKTSDVLNNQSFEFLMMTVDSLKLFDGENSGGLVNHDGHDLIICKSTSNIVGVYSIIPVGLCCPDKLKKSISEGLATIYDAMYDFKCIGSKSGNIKLEYNNVW